MATYVSVPLKNTWEVDLVKPLKTFIQNTYEGPNNESLPEVNQALTEFNKLRNTMISKWGDKHESALDVLYRYYDQLCAIETKLPIAENQIRVDFKWQDAFDKESFWGGKRTLKIPSASYEKVCVLFNIAALQSQIAKTMSHETDEGLKGSAKLLQQASGIYSYLKDCVMSHVQNDPTPDLHPDTLGALSAVMLAQAQDSFYQKTVRDRMKPGIIARVANQCSDLYAEALKLLQLSSIKDLWPKDWVPLVAAREAATHAMAEYYQSELLKESKHFGEQIARLRHANELMAAAETRGGSAFCWRDDANKIQQSLKDAEKDNNFIYHEKIPDRKALSAIQKAALAKPLPIATPIGKSFTDLFAKVVPLTVHNAVVNFDNMKAQVINQEVGRLREATQLMNSILASLNLPAAIEDLGGTSVPPSVLEKAKQVRDAGGINVIKNLMEELPSLLQRNREILDEACKNLDDEENSDKQLKEQFKERWTRTPSAKLTEPIKAEAAKYRAILDNAVKADAVVKQRFSDHKQNIELLSKTDEEISKGLPSASTAANLKGSPVVKELNRLMQEVNNIKQERDQLEAEIKDVTCDISAKFLAALAADGTLTGEATLGQQEIDSVFGPLRERVNKSLQEQENVLAKVQTTNMEFCNAKSQNQSAKNRETVLKDLAAAYDSFSELKSNLIEGTKFYNDLTVLLVKFQTKANDFCFARKTEKEELMKDLQQNIASQRSAPPPAVPGYQQEGGSSESRNPPPRPPPPQIPAQTQVTAPTSTAPPAVSAAGQMPYPVQPMPYPVAPGYAPPPMPVGYNPYYYPPQQPGGYGGYPPAYPQQQYPGYPSYPRQ